MVLNFYQLLHQGTEIIPCDFIAILNPEHNHNKHHEILLANCFSQSQALMMGKSYTQETKELVTKNNIPEKMNSILKHKEFTGNRPSNTILLNKLSPESLGNLICLYEHKVFTQGIIWNINSFDQYGVELGKELAKEILKEIENNNENIVTKFDSSTNGLINRYIKQKK